MKTQIKIAHTLSDNPKWIITDERQGLDYVWNGVGLTVNIFHTTNPDTVLDCLTIREPATFRNFKKSVMQRIKDNAEGQD